VVWDTVEKPAVTSLLVNVATTSGISAVVHELAISMMDGLAASKPPSQVVVETCGAGISGSGRVSVSGSICASGTMFTPWASRARDLVTRAVPSNSSNASTRLQIGVE